MLANVPFLELGPNWYDTSAYFDVQQGGGGLTVLGQREPYQGPPIFNTTRLDPRLGVSTSPLSIPAEQGAPIATAAANSMSGSNLMPILIIGGLAFLLLKGGK